MEGMALQMRLRQLLDDLKMERANIVLAESDLEMHRTKMVSNQIENMLHPNRKLLTMFDKTREKSLQEGVASVRARVLMIEEKIREIRAEEARVAEALRLAEEHRRLAEERRLVEMERARIQQEWDQASYFYRPVLLAKRLGNWATSKKQGKKQRKNHKSKKSKKNKRNSK